MTARTRFAAALLGCLALAACGRGAPQDTKPAHQVVRPRAPRPPMPAGAIERQQRMAQRIRQAERRRQERARHERERDAHRARLREQRAREIAVFRAALLEHRAWMESQRRTVARRPVARVRPHAYAYGRTYGRRGGGSAPRLDYPLTVTGLGG